MACVGPWSATRRVAVAVSGGADSLCLAYLCAGWGQPLGLIVDHGLRPESSAEAAETAKRLVGFSVPSRILRLQGLAPGPGLAARARAARYEALVGAAREAGCVDLLLGHHRLDQAETLLMRQGAGSGAAGLAGMADVVESHDVRFIRPLLGVPPGRLRATLRAAGLAWVDDPSNRNPAALRTRLREDLADADGTAPATRTLAAEAAAHGSARAKLESETADILARRVAVFPEGYAVLSPGELPVAALAALIRCVGGNPYPEAGASLARLAAAPGEAVLGGVRFLSAGRLGPGLLVVREAAAMAPPLAALDGALWDSRFRVALEAGLPAGLEVGALGPDSVALRQASNLPAAVLQTLPALRLHGMLAAVPHIGYRHAVMHGSVAVRFSPAHPLAGGPFGRIGGGCQGPREPPCEMQTQGNPCA
jgi:tRNA(Ile)-lysidine synthase